MIAVAAFVWFVLPDEDSLASILQDAGYFELVPPSTFHGPGTINTVESLSNGKVQLHPTCNLDEAILARWTLESRTVERRLRQGISRSFDISAKVRDYLAQAGMAERTTNVDITFEQVSILLMTGETLNRIQQEVIKGSCQEVIVWNLNAGGLVCQTEAVLKADVRYEIGFRNEVSASERAKLTRDLAAEFQITVDQDDHDRIVGEGLFFGVKFWPRGIVRNDPRTGSTDCRAALGR